MATYSFLVRQKYHMIVYHPNYYDSKTGVAEVGLMPSWITITILKQELRKLDWQFGFWLCVLNCTITWHQPGFTQTNIKISELISELNLTVT